MNMQLDLYQVDAFATRTFEGNPAAICPLDNWLEDKVLQQIAEENNLSETAYFVREQEHYHLRWFTPAAEVDLCGHATLAAAHVLFSHLGHSEPEIHFMTRSGMLTVSRSDAGLSMDFPASVLREVEPPAQLVAGLGRQPTAVYADFDYIAVFEDETDIRELAPNFLLLSELDLRGVVATAPGRQQDFVSRCFYPLHNINEDPVTGSAHCQLAPYWSERLGKQVLQAKQISRRGGLVQCTLHGDRVILTGTAVDYLQGKIYLNL